MFYEQIGRKGEPTTENNYGKRRLSRTTENFTGRAANTSLVHHARPRARRQGRKGDTYILKTTWVLQRNVKCASA